MGLQIASRSLQTWFNRQMLLLPHWFIMPSHLLNNVVQSALTSIQWSGHPRRNGARAAGGCLKTTQVREVESIYSSIWCQKTASLV